MFQCALGRIGSIVTLPPRSLPVLVYLDAGGRAAENRVWGGLATFGRPEDHWLATAMSDLRESYFDEAGDSRELKGRDLSDAAIRAAGRRIRDENRQIVFWANWFPSYTRDEVELLVERVLQAVRRVKANPFHREREMIQAYDDNIASYLGALRPANRWKLLSIVGHLDWLVGEVGRVGLGPQIASVTVQIDRENFPDVSQCASVIKGYLAAGFQNVGMSLRLTGRVMCEQPDQGAIRVDADTDSEDSAGLQYADILLQAVQRRLPGYEGRKLRRDNAPGSARLDESAPGD